MLGFGGRHNRSIGLALNRAATTSNILQQLIQVCKSLGDFLAINCQRLSKETWESREEVSLHRGLAAMRARLPVPLWIIQKADQEVELWPLIGDVPIFTEHVSAQFGWMLEAAFDRGDSQRRYPEDSGLILSAPLAERCRGLDADV